MTNVYEIIRQIPVDQRNHLIPPGTILTVLRGSLSHGTHVEKTEKDSIDDVDIMSVYIREPEFYLGLPSVARGKDIKIDEWDAANYELRHFCSLLARGNPNVVSALWVKADHSVATMAGLELVHAREHFLSKRLYHSFAGYAHGQLQRMTSFKDVHNTCGCEGEFHSAQCVENLSHGRGSQKRFATGYMGEKRKALVAKHGFDAKNAAHAIRLLKMAIDIFEKGIVIVDRTGIDAEEIMKIKKGEVSLPEIQAMSASLLERLKVSAEKSDLPEEPDTKRINKILIKILTNSITTT